MGAGEMSQRAALCLVLFAVSVEVRLFCRQPQSETALPSRHSLGERSSTLCGHSSGRLAPSAASQLAGVCRKCKEECNCQFGQPTAAFRREGGTLCLRIGIGTGAAFQGCHSCQNCRRIRAEQLLARAERDRSLPGKKSDSARFGRPVLTVIPLPLYTTGEPFSRSVSDEREADQGHGKRDCNSGERVVRGEVAASSTHRDPLYVHCFCVHAWSLLVTPLQINLVSNHAIVNPDWISSTYDMTGSTGVPQSSYASSLTLDVGAVWYNAWQAATGYSGAVYGQDSGKTGEQRNSSTTASCLCPTPIGCQALCSPRPQVSRSTRGRFRGSAASPARARCSASPSARRLRAMCPPS